MLATTQPLDSRVVQVTAGAGVLAARTHARLHILRLHREKSKPNVKLRRYLDVLDSMTLPGVLHCALHPTIPAELAAVGPDRSVHIWSPRPAGRRHTTLALRHTEDQSEECVWAHCRFGWHPRSLTLALPRSLHAVDLRQATANNLRLPADVAEEGIFAMGMSETPWHMAVATRQRLVVLDARATSRAVCTWRHRQPHLPPCEIFFHSRQRSLGGDGLASVIITSNGHPAGTVLYPWENPGPDPAHAATFSSISRPSVPVRLPALPGTAAHSQALRGCVTAMMWHERAPVPPPALDSPQPQARQQQPQQHHEPMSVSPQPLPSSANAAVAGAVDGQAQPREGGLRPSVQPPNPNPLVHPPQPPGQRTLADISRVLMLPDGSLQVLTCKLTTTERVHSPTTDMPPVSPSSSASALSASSSALQIRPSFQNTDLTCLFESAWGLPRAAKLPKLPFKQPDRFAKRRKVIQVIPKSSNVDYSTVPTHASLVRCINVEQEKVKALLATPRTLTELSAFLLPRLQQDNEGLWDEEAPCNRVLDSAVLDAVALALLSFAREQSEVEASLGAMRPRVDLDKPSFRIFSHRVAERSLFPQPRQTQDLRSRLSHSSLLFYAHSQAIDVPFPTPPEAPTSQTQDLSQNLDFLLSALGETGAETGTVSKALEEEDDKRDNSEFDLRTRLVQLGDLWRTQSQQYDNREGLS